MFRPNITFRYKRYVFWSTDGCEARVLLCFDGKPPPVFFRKGNIMQQVDRVRTVSDHRSAVPPRDASRFADAIRRAQVTTLGDYISRQSRAAREERIPTRAHRRRRAALAHLVRAEGKTSCSRRSAPRTMPACFRSSSSFLCRAARCSAKPPAIRTSCTFPPMASSPCAMSSRMERRWKSR